MRPGGPRKPATRRDWAAAAATWLVFALLFALTFQAAGSLPLMLGLWVALAVGYFVVLALPDVRARREARGQCPSCGYSRVGLEGEARCPECGG